MENKATTDAFLDAHGITQAEAGSMLGITGSAVSRKLSGDRKWHLAEMHRLLDALEPRIGRRPTLDEVFGRDCDPAPEPEPGGFDCPCATVAPTPDL